MNHRRMVWLLRGLMLLGVLAIGNYFAWWRDGGRIFSPWLALGLVFAAVYHWTQLLGSWALYLAARRRTTPPRLVDGLSIDVLVTACGEPYSLVERSLAAACALRGAHHTWLLDDGGDPRLARLAAQLGAGYLTRADRTNAKAGNLNAALARTTGDLVVIFDVDHAPTPDFLERTAGYFSDPQVGFVQVMLTFVNARQNWVARAATESTLDFYNPTCMGKDGLGSATLVGSNALIRRTALDSIGGYQPGLAEDLATSIALHAAGWHSIYVAEPLAPGLAAPDLGAWFTQQFKWARGVFELLLTAYPRYFGRLTWGQRLAYAVRMTYYWLGSVIAVHLVFTFAILVGGGQVAQIDFQQYLLRYLPVAVLALLLRQTALRAWRHPSVSTAFVWRALLLVYATWPIYSVAWLMAVLRLPLAFRPTPKRRGVLNPLWLLPHTLTLLLLGSAVLLTLAGAPQARSPILFCFAFIQSAPQVVLLWQALRSYLAPGWRAQPGELAAEPKVSAPEVSS